MVIDVSESDVGDKASISIPGISEILVIGDSPTASNFVDQINTVTRGMSIHTAKTIEKAAIILSNVKFSIVVIDNDSDFDPISCSRLVSVHYSQARIVLISRHYDELSVMDLKNKGVIHAHISLPTIDILAHTILVQEQSKYHINQTLQKMITSPPEESSSYRLLSSNRLNIVPQQKKKFDLLAVSIVYETVSKFNVLYDKSFEMEPILLSSYFSAISIFSERILTKQPMLESFEFGDVNVYINNIDGVQYVYVFRNVNEENRGDVDELVRNLSKKLHIGFSEEFINDKLLKNDTRINDMIDYYLPNHQKDSSFFEPEKKSKIINVHEPNEILAEFYDDTSRVYDVYYVDDENQLMDMLEVDDFHVVIINRFEENFDQNKILLNIIKDLSPSSQTIGIIDNPGSKHISNILNVNDLDFVLPSEADMEKIFSLIKRGIDRARSIENGMIITDLNRIYRIHNKPEIIKTMLRKNIDKFGQSTIPVFNGVFILIDNKKYYSYYTVEDKNQIADNEEMFMDFINSLMTFTDELKHSPLVLSGIKYGNSNIILQDIKKYHFMYFIGSLDRTNYDLVHQVLSKKTEEIYNVIKYDVNPHELSDGLNVLIDEICVEINKKFKQIKVE